MSRIKLYTKNFVILFISMQLVNLMIVYFETQYFNKMRKDNVTMLKIK